MEQAKLDPAVTSHTPQQHTTCLYLLLPGAAWDRRARAAARDASPPLLMHIRAGTQYALLSA